MLRVSLTNDNIDDYRRPDNRRNRIQRDNPRLTGQNTNQIAK